MAKELAEQKEEFIRKMADMDNNRKRCSGQETAIQFANERLQNDLIPILMISSGQSMPATKGDPQSNAEESSYPKQLTMS